MIVKRYVKCYNGAVQTSSKNSNSAWEGYQTCLQEKAELELSLGRQIQLTGEEDKVSSVEVRILDGIEVSEHTRHPRAMFKSEELKRKEYVHVPHTLSLESYGDQS